MKIIFAICIALSPFVIFIFKYPIAPQRDWLYFNSLSLINSEYLKIGRLPILDLWVCGGVDVFANPQNWLFSPSVLLNIIFPPYLGNLISILLFSIAGFFGMKKLTENNTNQINNILISIVFILSPFFFLHFSEGHLIFRSLYLLPLIFYLAQSLDSLRKIFYLLITLALMFLDGGIYPFFFSLFLIALNLNYKSLKKLFNNKAQILNIFIMFLGFVFVISAKLIPILSVHSKRAPQLETFTYSLNQFLYSILNIKQSNISRWGSRMFTNHEYDLYFGVSLIILILISLRQFKHFKWIVAQFFFFSWIAYGFGGEFNPWTIHQKIPFLNQIHVQSRFLIIVFFLALFMISRVKMSEKIKTALLTTAIIELLFCGFYINNAAFEKNYNVNDYSVRPLEKIYHNTHS